MRAALAVPVLVVVGIAALSGGIAGASDAAQSDVLHNPVWAYPNAEHNGGLESSRWGFIQERRSTNHSANSTTLRGVTIRLPRANASLREFAAQSLNRSPSSLPPYAVLFVVEDRIYIALSPVLIRNGIATLVGAVHAPQTNGGASTLFIERIETFNSTGEPVFPTNLAERIGTTGHLSDKYRRTGVVLLDDDGRPGSTATFGHIGGEQLDFRLLEFPGIVARHTVVRGAEQEATRRVGLELITGTPTRGTGFTFWIDAETNVSGAIISADFPVYDLDRPGFLTTTVDVKDGNEIAFAELRAEPERYEGEVVTFRSQLVGERFSTARTLSTAGDCGPGEFELVDGRCRIIGGDVSVHAGVLFKRSSAQWSSVLPYAALSNAGGNHSPVAEAGVYRVTGRVVPAETVDPRLETSHAFLVYERQRLDRHFDAAPTAARDKYQVIADLLQWQVTSTAGQRRSLYEAARQRAGPPVQLTNGSITPETAEAGEPITLTATIANEGSSSQTMTLEVNDGSTVFDVTTIEIDPRSEHRVTFEFAVFKSGPLTLRVNNWTVGDIRIRAQTATSASNSNPGPELGSEPIRLGATGLALVIALAIGLAYHRSR